MLAMYGMQGVHMWFVGFPLALIALGMGYKTLIKAKTKGVYVNLGLAIGWVIVALSALMVIGGIAMKVSFISGKGCPMMERMQHHSTPVSPEGR